METTHAVALLDRLHDAQNQFYGGGDSGPLAELLAAAIVWTVPGNNQIAGRYQGLEEVFTPERGREVDDALARAGHTRRLVVTVPHFSSVFAVVESSDCVAAVPRKLAHYYAQRQALRHFELPLTIPNYEVRLYWHVRADADPGVVALRAMTRDVLNAL